MKSKYWLCLIITLLWAYPPISYSLSPDEEKAKELLRSQLDPGKKAKKGAANLQNNQIPTDPIRPFGPFSWEDDFLTAVSKANALPGIETVSLEGLNLRGIQTKEQLQQVLTDYLNKSLFPISKLDSLESINIAGEYINSSGNSGIYFKAPIKIEVKPIVIASVPFTLTITLSSTPGLAITNTDRVLSALTFTEGSPTAISVAFPVVLAGVALSSDSFILNQKLPEIEKLLEEKYRKYDPSHHHVTEWKNGGILHDPTTNNQTWLTIYGPYPFFLGYESHSYGLALQQKYIEHLANLESDKLRGKTDLKGGL